MRGWVGDRPALHEHVATNPSNVSSFRAIGVVLAPNNLTHLVKQLLRWRKDALSSDEWLDVNKV